MVVQFGLAHVLAYFSARALSHNNCLIIFLQESDFGPCVDEQTYTCPDETLHRRQKYSFYTFIRKRKNVFFSQAKIVSYIGKVTLRLISKV